MCGHLTTTGLAALTARLATPPSRRPTVGPFANAVARWFHPETPRGAWYWDGP